MERTLNKSEITSFIDSVAPALARKTGYHENICIEFLQSIGFASNWTLWERYHRPVDIRELAEIMYGMVTYGVWGAENRTNNDYADWFDDCQEALLYARKIVDEEGSAYVMKFINDECAWDFGIEVTKYGAWSDSYAAREEMGCIQ